MNVTDLIAAVRRRTGLSSSDAFAADADLIEIIAEVSNAISTERDWPWLETSTTLTTAAGTQAYAMPADWVRTRTLAVSGSGPMDSTRSRQDLDGWFAASDSSGEPQFFVVSGDVLRLYPTPDRAYSVTHVYYRQETQLASGSDTPLIPSWAHGAIVYAAAAVLLRRVGEDARAEQAQRQADAWMRRLVDNSRRTSGPVRVRVRAGGFL